MTEHGERHKTKSEMGLPVIPQDEQWFYDWRRQMNERLERLITKLDSQSEHQQEFRIALMKNGQQIENLAIRLQQTYEHLHAVDARVVVLERKAEAGSAVHHAHETAEKKSRLNMAIDGFASNSGMIFAAGLFAVGAFLLKLFFTADKS